MVTELEALKYNEALELPKFKVAIDRLLNRKEFEFILDTHSVTAAQLTEFVDKATREGNSILIQREYNGYMVVVWKD